MATLAPGPARAPSPPARAYMSPPPAAPRLDALPRDVLLRLLAQLTFEEICVVRAVCRTLARAAEEALMRAFDSYGPRILRRLRDLRLSPDFSFHTCLVCKTLYLVEIEYRVVRAAVGVYVREGSAPFVGGRLLDLLEHALRLSYAHGLAAEGYAAEAAQTSGLKLGRFNNLFTPEIVDELSRLVELYISFFETEVEPRLRAPTPLGVKLVDILDAFAGGASDAELRSHGGWRWLRGRYHLPLTGLLFHDEDIEPTSRITVPESEATSLLAAPRCACASFSTSGLWRRTAWACRLTMRARRAPSTPPAGVGTTRTRTARRRRFQPPAKERRRPTTTRAPPSGSSWKCIACARAAPPCSTGRCRRSGRCTASAGE